MWGFRRGSGALFRVYLTEGKVEISGFYDLRVREGELDKGNNEHTKWIYWENYHANTEKRVIN